MSVIVKGNRYRKWADWREGKPPATLGLDPSQQNCPTCWGQGKLWRPASNGEGYVPGLCDDCLGTGVKYVLDIRLG